MEEAHLDEVTNPYVQTSTNQEKEIGDKLECLHLPPENNAEFSAAKAESPNYENCENGDEINHGTEENKPEQFNKEKRRGSLERYKPPTPYSKEEREKHRRRGHFGENKGQDDLQQEQTDSFKGGKKEGRPHGRYRGKGRGGQDSLPEDQNSLNGPNADQESNKPEQPQANGDRPFFYKTQLSKDWADYSYEEENEQVEETQSKSPKEASSSNQRHRNQPPQEHNTERYKYGNRPNQHHNHRHQQEQIDLRQKLNEKRAANVTGDGGQNQNYRQTYHEGNDKHQQRAFGRDSHNDKSHNSERYNNGRNRGERGSDRDKPNNQYAPSVAGKLPRPKKNTENFNPCHDPPQMRILFATPGMQTYDRPCGSRDVIVVRDLFIPPGVDPNSDFSIYEQLLSEIHQSGVDERLLWQSWHGDSHLIADDKKNWKKACPTFSSIVDKLAEYFRMDVKATRLNWYRDSSEWKPFHHDAAALKPDKARSQNFTVGVSFGAERDAAFEHAQNRCIISMPQPNGTVYTFGRDVNILWRHGIPQVPPDMHHQNGRISIIAWGWADTFDM